MILQYNMQEVLETQGIHHFLLIYFYSVQLKRVILSEISGYNVEQSIYGFILA